MRLQSVSNDDVACCLRRPDVCTFPARCCRTTADVCVCVLVVLPALDKQQHQQQTQFQWAAEKLGFTPSMFFDEGKQWGRARRVIAPSLNGHNVAAMIPIMNKVRCDMSTSSLSLIHI